MTAQIEFAKNLAVVLKAGLSKDERSMAESVRAYAALTANAELKAATNAFYEEAGLMVLQNPGKSRLYIVPTDADSIFSMKMADVRKNLKTDADSALLAFAYLLVISTFYPTRYALNKGELHGITVEDVYATGSRIVKLAAVDRQEYGESQSASIAELWADMSVSDNGKGTKKNFQEYYVVAALRSLTDNKMVRQKESEGQWYPTDRLAAIAVQRFDDRSTLAAIMADTLHDQNEME